MYAYDTILFFEAAPEACLELKKVLNLYGHLAGQSINHQKSSLIFSPNTPRTFKKFLSSTFGVSYKPNLGRYLGVYVDKPSFKANFSELLETVNQKLSGWKARLLSRAGRLVLIKSVLTSIPLYRMGSFAFPKKVLHQLDAAVINFFWGFKSDRPAMHMLNKHILFAPKSIGGLNIRSFSLMNQALLAKQFWRLTQQPNSLFASWTISKYFKGNLESLPHHTSQPTPVWKGLAQNLDLIRSQLWWKINLGNNVNITSPFWWRPSLPTSTPNLTVSHFLDITKATWKTDELASLYSSEVLSQITRIPFSLSSINDQLMWKPASDGHYTVSKGYQLLLHRHEALSSSTNIISSLDWHWLWKIDLPPKFIIFLWRPVHSAIPAAAVLRQHHIDSHQPCLFCNDPDESLTHLFIYCPFSHAVWFGSSRSLLSTSVVTNFSDWLVSFLLHFKNGGDSTLYHCKLFIIILYFIWEAHNKLLHEAILPSPSQVICKSQSYLQVYQAASTKVSTTPSSRIHRNQITAQHFSKDLYINGSNTFFFLHKNSHNTYVLCLSHA